MRPQAKATCFFAGLFALACLLAPRATPGQIATTVDTQGKTVYINADPPRSRAKSGASASSATPNAAGTNTAVQMAQTNIANEPQVAPAGLFLGRSGASSQASPALDEVINDAAYRHRVDPALVKAVINTESAWNPRAISRKGALGLMQLIPSTAQRFGVANAFDPAQNIEGGTTYLRTLLDRYNGDLTKSLAAYNAGEHIVDLKNGVPPYRETQRYVQKVTKTYFQSDDGRDQTLLNPLRPKVRQEVDSSGRVVFTNE
jgi:soluble lytic murein transglycosylase-like protein